jgi:drug/metabolite transporter (DMT)-like permease
MADSSSYDYIAEAAEPERGVSPFIWIALPFFVSVYQILSKIVADRMPVGGTAMDWLGAIFSQPLIILLVASEIISFGLWMYALARMQLSAAFPLSAISYVFVIFTSWAIFDETGSVSQIMGTASILVGAWLIGRPKEVDAFASDI